MTDNPEQATVPNELLISFLNHDLAAADSFIKAVDPYLLKLARAKAPELPTDLHEEIVNETYLRLLCMSPEKFNPERGSVKAFLYGELRNAVQQVRAMYCAPGHPTRDRKPKVEPDNKDIIHDDSVLMDHTTDRLPPLVSIVALGADELPAPNGAADIQANCDVNRILEMAPALVAAGLDRIYFGGYTLAETAESLAVSRFKLRRDINAFTQQFQHAA